MGEYINIKDRINQIDELINSKNEELNILDTDWRNIINERHNINNKIKSLRIEKEVLLAQSNLSEIAYKFFSKHKDLDYKYVGKMNSPQHGFANCNKCLVPLELFKGNTGIGEVEIGVCPKCEIEVNFTDYSKW